MDGARGSDGASVAVEFEPVWDNLRYSTVWTCEKWFEDKVESARKKYSGLGREVGSNALRACGLEPDVVEVVNGNVLLNEGIARMWDLIIAAGGTAYNNANAFIGVGDTSTAAAATDTELLATQNAAN